MDLANKWANGEDAAGNKRARSPEEDKARRGNDRRRWTRNYGDYDQSVQIAASFASKDDRKIDHHNSRYRGNNRDESRSRFEPHLEMTEEQMLNEPWNMHYYIDDEGRRQPNHLLIVAGPFSGCSQSSEEQIRVLQARS
jgi:hypothetical protein